MDSNRPKVKICCIGSADEAELAISLGASALGFVSEMPSGPGVIAETLISQIIALVPPEIDTFLLTSAVTADAIIAQQKQTRANTIQIVDRLQPGTLQELRQALPGITLVQVIHVTGSDALAEAISIASEVDAILLDSGNPSLDVKELGGTGRTHDWSVSRLIRQSVDVPVWLAGGLRSDNVADAIREVNPYGVDLCSGVRTGGKLDREKLVAFFAEANGI